MSKNTDVTMGLPRLSGKRSWTEADGDSGSGLPSKILCTSPPHAICAEDVPQSSPPTCSETANVGCKMDDGKEDKAAITSEADAEKECRTVFASDPDGYERLSESEDENFIDDEEDKDSGFIDGNSIDNSSDDDDSKEHNFSTSNIAAFTSFGSQVSFASESSPKTTIEVSLGESTPSIDTGSAVTLTTDTTSSQSGMETKMSVSTSFLISGPTFSNALTSSLATTFQGSKALDTSTTTAASTLTGTVVTSSYQGSVSSLSYDLHPYPNMHPTNPYFHRPGTPAWSCNFYDGSQPNTNKYMEISPNRSLPNQSIQCDENGKSYMELGSAAPYNNSYTAECSTFTTSQSTYQSSTYTSSFAGTNNFGPPSSYYNSRQPYGQNFSYNQNEPYNYENDNVCSYSYAGSYNNGLLRGNNGMLNRSNPRCTSPYCDPTKSSPRSGCYNQQRLTVFNMSMFKLNRFSRFPEPNLRRSVLICNTLRHIEKEFESEGISMSAIIASHNQAAYGPQPHPPNNDTSNQNNGISLENVPSMSHSSSNNEGPLPSIHPPIVGGHHQLAPFSPSTTNQPLPAPPLSSSFSSSPPSTCQNLPYSSEAEPNLNLENKNPLPSLRQYTQSPILSPQVNMDSEPESSSWSSKINVSNNEEKAEGINWCSVLSLSSQSDLDSVNNNECNDWTSEESIVLPYSTNREESSSSEKLPSLSVDDVLKSFPETRRPEPTGEIESLIKDMLGS